MGKADRGVRTRRQADVDDKLTQALIIADREARILDAIRNGHSIHETAVDLGISTTAVRSLISDVLASYQESAVEHAEYVYMVNHIRLEAIFGRAMGNAFNPRFDNNGIPIIFDKSARLWAQLAITTLKEQNRMAESQLKHKSPQSPDDKNDPTKANVNIFSPTIVAGDEMFAMAQKSMSSDFMDRHGHRLLPGDEDPADMLVMELTNPSHKYEKSPSELPLADGVLSIADKLEQLQQKLGEVPSEEDDEEGDLGRTVIS